MRQGRPAVLFLSRRTRGFPDKWSFEPWAGYGLLDDSGTRVFCYPIRGELIDRFRRRVDWEAWQPRHPFESRVFGNVLGVSSTDLFLTAGAGIVETTDEYSVTLEVNVPCSPGSPRIGRH